MRFRFLVHPGLPGTLSREPWQCNATGAQPSGCTTVKDEAGAEICRRRSMIPSFCSLKAALPHSKMGKMDRVLPDMLRCWSGGGPVNEEGRMQNAEEGPVTA